MKSGLTFSTIGIIFGIHRTTVSDIFFSLVQYLNKAYAGVRRGVYATSNLATWLQVAEQSTRASAELVRPRVRSDGHFGQYHNRVTDATCCCIVKILSWKASESATSAPGGQC
ncbi:unnamed protein product [Trichogramma brassicae]|uniref:Uncharacterized protein n=1 Tax=Trichogramma brassicae TaxID=86971 RepID=A0A6H5IP73_9HYME|nr:unnamed protein product [Trichogramma brassicae]